MIYLKPTNKKKKDLSEAMEMMEYKSNRKGFSTHKKKPHKQLLLLKIYNFLHQTDGWGELCGLVRKFLGPHYSIENDWWGVIPHDSWLNS